LSAAVASQLAGSTVVYVSLPPGAIPNGIAADISVLRTGSSVSRPLVDGGFDPVAVSAVVGDTIAVTVHVTGAASTVSVRFKVEPSTPPVIVRTDPPPHKRDVPLNASLRIVFSAPIDAATLTDSAISLRHGTTTVAGHLAFVDAAHTSVQFVPAGPLEAETDYALLITPAIHDVSGVALTSSGTVDFVTAANPLVQPVGRFIQTGDMITARHGHTATLLLDGRVLITGGDGPGRSTELYDPATGTFVNTGPMFEPRAGHTATLLTNGQVLIAGPATSSGAELYDPATGTFVRTGSMLTPQYIQSATMLPSGSVLIAGDSAAELFDPATGKFRRAGSYNTAVPAYDNLYYYSATLLADGRVLFNGMPDCAQLYDPAGDTFRVTGCMRLDGLELHTSTLLSNGKVLIAGGGNDELGGRSTIAQIYDPATGTFSRTADMRSNRAAHGAVRLNDGKVLILGGDTNGNNGNYAGVLADAELYDPATGTFAAAGSMNAARALPQATLLKNGDVLITGGVSGTGSSVIAELYHAAVSAPTIAQRGRLP
jgi:hypothetical protein